MGISLSFASGQNLENNAEIIGILNTEKTGFTEAYDCVVINRPEKLQLKSDCISELEMKFVDLSSGIVFPSIFKSDMEEIYVSMSFSDL